MSTVRRKAKAKGRRHRPVNQHFLDTEQCRFKDAEALARTVAGTAVQQLRVLLQLHRLPTLHHTGPRLNMDRTTIGRAKPEATPHDGRMVAEPHQSSTVVCESGVLNGSGTDVSVAEVLQVEVGTGGCVSLG